MLLTLISPFGLRSDSLGSMAIVTLNYKRTTRKPQIHREVRGGSPNELGI